MGDLPVTLRAYLIAAISAGWALPVALVAARAPELDRGDAVRVVLLTVLAAVAERFTLHLTHKTSVNVAAATCMAAILIVPPALAGLLVLTGGAIGYLSQRQRDVIESLFNAGQRALVVLCAAALYQDLRELTWLGPEIGGFGSIGAIALAAIMAHAINGMLVAVAAGLQLGTNITRVWRVTLLEDLSAQAAMAAIGVVGAFLALHEPLLVPILVVPLVLVHTSLRENVRLRRDTYRALGELVDIVELRDPYTAGHSQRVGDLCRAIALQLGLTHEEADLIQIAGHVHDVGKIGVDPVVLTKPGRLTDAEYAEMKRHPVIGAQVVSRFSAYQAGVPIVRHHHERWDGHGYPDKLAGADIPLGARIVAVADTYDALTSGRPYREARTPEIAERIIVEGAGVQWDPDVVLALRAHLAQSGAVGNSAERSTAVSKSGEAMPARSLAG